VTDFPTVLITASLPRYSAATAADSRKLLVSDLALLQSAEPSRRNNNSGQVSALFLTCTVHIISCKMTVLLYLLLWASEQ
jgi:hypothetical protein